MEKAGGGGAEVKKFRRDERDFESPAAPPSFPIDRTMAEYPQGNLQNLLKSPLVTEATRKALTERLEAKPTAESTVFNAEEEQTLTAVCGRLLPPDSPLTPEAATGKIAERLAGDRGDGWRYDALPPDREAYKQGLRGLDEAAALDKGRPAVERFVALSPERQEEVLRAVSQGRAEGATWKALPGQRFYEELLAAVTELYAAHPRVSTLR